jgi:hypothetical protein
MIGDNNGILSLPSPSSPSTIKYPGQAILGAKLLHDYGFWNVRVSDGDRERERLLITTITLNPKSQSLTKVTPPLPHPLCQAIEGGCLAWKNAGLPLKKFA